MAEHQLPKLIVRVRFPSSALMVKAQVGRDFRTLGLVSFWGLKPAAGHYRAIGNPVNGLSADPAAGRCRTGVDRCDRGSSGRRPPKAGRFAGYARVSRCCGPAVSVIAGHRGRISPLLTRSNLAGAL
jgi:hypothetical protein